MIDRALKELKHSVYTHLILQGGPNPQLCVFLTKLLDCMDDMNAVIHNGRHTAHAERLEQELLNLSFHIIESLAVWLANSLDEKKAPAHIYSKAQNLLLLTAKTRKYPDRIASKNIVLRGIADMVKTIKSNNPNIQMPDIRDAQDNIL